MTYTVKCIVPRAREKSARVNIVSLHCQGFGLSDEARSDTTGGYNLGGNCDAHSQYVTCFTASGGDPWYVTTRIEIFSAMHRTARESVSKIFPSGWTIEKYVDQVMDIYFVRPGTTDCIVKFLSASAVASLWLTRRPERGGGEPFE